MLYAVRLTATVAPAGIRFNAIVVHDSLQDVFIASNIC